MILHVSFRKEKGIGVAPVLRVFAVAFVSYSRNELVMRGGGTNLTTDRHRRRIKIADAWFRRVRLQNIFEFILQI
jgi:hypothetical protein